MWWPPGHKSLLTWMTWRGLRRGGTSKLPRPQGSSTWRTTRWREGSAIVTGIGGHQISSHKHEMAAVCVIQMAECSSYTADNKQLNNINQTNSGGRKILNSIQTEAFQTSPGSWWLRICVSNTSLYFHGLGMGVRIDNHIVCPSNQYNTFVQSGSPNTYCF